MKDFPKFLNPKRLLGREGWKFYKHNCNKQFKAKNINRDNHPLIVNRFFELAKESLLENKSGVYLHGLGYFCILMYPKRMMLRNKFSKTGAKHLNIETDYRNYSPQWIHRMTNYNGYYPWTLDRAFSDSGVRRPLAKLLRAGKKYLMELKLIESLKSAK